MGLHDLPTLAEMNARPRACPKGSPHVLVKKARERTKAERERAFRAAVWARDQSRSRASGKPLAKSGTDYERVGEVHHVLKRSTHPEDIWTPTNGILLSKAEHALAETRCPADPSRFLLTISGPDDRSRPQTFIWRDQHGTVLRTRLG